MSESVDAFAELWQKERDKVRLSPPGRSPPRDASHGFGPSAHIDRVMNPPSSRPSTYGSNGQTSSRSDMASNARPFDTHRGMNPPSRPSAYGSNGQSSSHFDMARNTSLLNTDRAIHPLLARSNAFDGRGQSSTRFDLPSNARLSDPDRPRSCLRPLRFDKSGNIESRSENNWDFFPRTTRPSENAFASRPINPTEPNTSDGTSDHSPPRIKLQLLSGTKEEKFKKLGAGILADIRQDSSSTATRKRPLEISDEDEECPNRPQQSQNTPYGLTIAKSCPLKQKEATNMDTLVSDTARTEHPTRDFAPRIPTTPQICPPGSWPEFTPAATRFADVTDNYVPEQAPDPASSWAGLTVRLTRAVGDNMARRSTSTARAVRVVGNHMTRHATNTARAVRVVGNNMTRHATNTARAVRVVGNGMSERATITARRAVNVVGTFKRRIQRVLHRDTNAEHGAEDHRRAAPADSDMPLIDAASVVDDDDDDVIDATLEPPHPVEMPSLDAASVVVEDDVMGATLEPRHPVEKPSPADGIFELVEIDSGSDFESSPSKSSNTFGHDSAIKPKSLKRAAPESEDPVYPSKRSETRAPVVSTPIRLRGSWLRKMFPAPLLNSHAVAEAKKAYLAGDPTRLKHINYMRMAHRYLPVPIPSIEVKETASEKPKITQPEEVKTKSILKTSSSAVASSSKSSVVDATTISFSDASHEKHTPKPKPSRRVHFPNSPVTGERIITPRNAPPALRTPSPPPRRAAIGHLRHLLDAHARNILSSEDTDVKAITDEEQKENIAPKAHDTTSRDMMSTEVTSHDLMSTERDMLSNEYMRTKDTNIEHVNTNQTTADEVISHEGTSDIAQESNTLSQDPSTQEAEQHPLGRAVSALESDSGGKRGERGKKKRAEPATHTRKNPPRAARSATPKR
ncbi:hypothetical protein BO99DRAFT_444499 [Aspergillus violaceofuscus CBS 115571]|uniref:Uncharacterized protein n=1 Tax=Aspergillus violaceofuscus (strain CBS 115571) TaxID=1450538 RepID=A0A2V5H669_ASPV1|nr:hypothetical protein BO99DRAFT_444499 [Aspergillus violaceofuscus CBS 115571]